MVFEKENNPCFDIFRTLEWIQRVTWFVFLTENIELGVWSKSAQTTFSSSLGPEVAPWSDRKLPDSLTWPVGILSATLTAGAQLSSLHFFPLNCPLKPPFAVNVKTRNSQRIRKVEMNDRFPSLIVIESQGCSSVHCREALWNSSNAHKWCSSKKFPHSALEVLF